MEEESCFLHVLWLYKWSLEVHFLASKPKGEPWHEHAAALGLEPACLFDTVLELEWELGFELALTVELWQVVGVLLALGLGMFPELLLQQVLFLPEEKTLSVRLLLFHGSQRRDATRYLALKSQSKMTPTPRKSSQAAVQGNSGEPAECTWSSSSLRRCCSVWPSPLPSYFAPLLLTHPESSSPCPSASVGSSDSCCTRRWRAHCSRSE